MIPRHRHIVAMPLAILTVMISLWGAQGADRMTGDAIPRDDALFGGRDFQEFTKGDYVLKSWSGFFFAAEQDGVLSVAALTTPVLVERTDDQRVVVPIGWQWRTGEELSRIPGHFLAQHLPNITAYLSVAVPDRFETAGEWILASVHPLMRDQAWVMPDPSGITLKDRWGRLMAFPESDILPKAASAFTMERWGIAVREFLKHSNDPGVFLNEFIPHIGRLIVWFREQGYPERAERYEEAINGIADEFNLFVSEESKMILQALRLEKTGTTSKYFEFVEVPADEEAPEAVSPDTFDSALIQQKTYILLRDMGALFTINTEIISQSATIAEVHGIVFGNHTFDFTIDVDRQIIDAISMDGKLMAYPMGVEEFKNWIMNLE